MCACEPAVLVSPSASCCTWQPFIHADSASIHEIQMICSISGSRRVGWSTGCARPLKPALSWGFTTRLCRQRREVRQQLDLVEQHVHGARERLVAEIAPEDNYGFGEDELRAGFGGSVSAASSVSAAAYEGRINSLYLKRRDMLRSFSLAPRDLRRIDPHLSFTRSSPTLYNRDDVLLVQLSGVRLIITSQSALLLDPNCRAAQQFLGQIMPKLQVNAGQRLMQEYSIGARHAMDADGDRGTDSEVQIPFELEVLEAALSVAVAKLDNELVRATERVQACLKRLPRDITPANLDDLRKIKSMLVELESASDAYRELLEDIMDDEDALKEINLSSRVLREERRRQRERDRLEREMAREREVLVREEAARRMSDDADAAQLDSRRADADTPDGGIGGMEAAAERVRGAGAAAGAVTGAGAPPRGAAGRGGTRAPQLHQNGFGVRGPVRAAADVVEDMSRAKDTVLRTAGYKAWERSLDLGQRGGGNLASTDDDDDPSGAAERSSGAKRKPKVEQIYSMDADNFEMVSDEEAASADLLNYEAANARAAKEQQAERASSDVDGKAAADKDSRHQNGNSPKTFKQLSDAAAVLQELRGTETEAQQELREWEEAKEEERDLEEVEDLLEFYLQRNTAIQTEAERLLAGARDLEESIGLALSARRFELSRLELQLSIGSFAAAIGAMLAGIFGMNLRSCLEDSVIGFWGTTIGIILGCVWVYHRIVVWTRKRKILI